MLLRTQLPILVAAMLFGSPWNGSQLAAAPVEASGGDVRISLPRLSYRHGQKMPLQIVSKGAGTVELLLKPEGEEQGPEDAHLITQIPSGEERTVPVPTSEVRPGNYTLQAVLRDNAGEYRSAADLEVAIVSVPAPPIAMGVIDVSEETLNEANLSALADQGFDVVYFRYADPSAPGGVRDMLDACYAHGLLSVPILDARSAIRWNDDLDGPRSQAAIKAEDWAQLLRPSLAPVYDRSNFPVLCPRNPEAMKLMEKYVDALATGVAGHPGAAAVALDRDAGVAFDWRGGGAGCFCEHCLSYFRKQTGKDAPPATYVAPGRVATDDDPMPAWLLLMGKPGGMTGGTMARYNERLKQVVARRDPNLPVVQLPGGYAGELSGSTYAVSYQRHRTVETKLTYQMDLARARQRNTGGPITVMFQGLDPDDAGTNLEQHLKVLGSIALARGARNLVYGPHAATTDEGVAAALTEVRGTVTKLGPMLANLTWERMPLAVLYSAVTEGYQQFLRWDEARDRWEQSKKWFEEPWEHEHSFYLGYSALLRNGLPVEIVTEQDVLGGELSNYEGLVLIDHEYSTQALEAKIREFQEGGKLVFADQSSVVRPPRALTIPTDFSVWSQMIPLGLRNTDPAVADIVRDRQFGLIREAAYYVKQGMGAHVHPWFEDLPPEVLYSTAYNGGSRYLILANTHPEEQRDVTLALTGDEEFVYDIAQSRRVLATRAGGRMQFATQLPPASLRVFLLASREITHLRVGAEQEGRVLKFDIAVGGEAGLRVSGSHPLKLVLTDPIGQEMALSGYYATDRGRLHLDMQLAKAEPVGLWTLTVSELASGLVRTQQLEVK